MERSFGESSLPIKERAGQEQAEPESDEREIRDMERENGLQLGWFMHRCADIQDEQEMEKTLQRMGNDNPLLAERVARSSREERQTILLESMIESPLGNAEAEWFRLHFPNDKSQPLAPAYRMVLVLFASGKADLANEELDRLFRESMVSH